MTMGELIAIGSLIIANGITLLKFYNWIKVKVAELELKHETMTKELESIAEANKETFKLLNEISIREARTTAIIDSIEQRTKRLEMHEDKRN